MRQVLPAYGGVDAVRGDQGVELLQDAWQDIPANRATAGRAT
ncbi:hypothetical protein OH768_23365 [Streptomyces sp. NBC_01622]|nr:hypothetical protein OH768_23365 [Streptomyces sp. NBC_01622]